MDPEHTPEPWTPLPVEPCDWILVGASRTMEPQPRALAGGESAEAVPPFMQAWAAMQVRSLRQCARWENVVGFALELIEEARHRHLRRLVMEKRLGGCWRAWASAISDQRRAQQCWWDAGEKGWISPTGAHWRAQVAKQARRNSAGPAGQPRRVDAPRPTSSASRT